MGYFPFFMELAGRRGLVIGGGAVALRKLGTLLPLGPQLTVVSPEMLPAVRALEGLQLLERPFAPEDLEGRDFVIAAAGSRAVNRQAAALCRARGILVDVADAGEEGTFLFPALVRRGRVSVGISTGGASPGMAAYLARRIEALLPEGLEEILLFMERQRRQTGPAAPERWAMLQALLERCMEAGRPLTAAETAAVIGAAGRQEGEGP